MPKKNKWIVPIQNSDFQEYQGTQELLDSETGLIRYSTEIVRKFFSKMKLQTRIIDESGSILEFGAGTGYLAGIFQSQFHIKPDCIELDPSLVEVIRQKDLKCFQFLSETSQNYTAIYSSNVLEHIEDDVTVLKELFESLVPGGVIGIYVPAHPILYSTMDKNIGHVRRYTRPELKRKVEASGFIIRVVQYDDFLGFFASSLVKVIGYKNAANLGSKKSLQFYDTVIYPVSKVLDYLGMRFLLGKNLLLIAERKV